MKKFGKMSLIFAFSISKLGYPEIVMKILWEKKFHPFFRTLLTSQNKNEDENEKNMGK